ncbi:MAG: hypothetical protein ACFFCW_39490 [Candidatus Hodarchaeota archaeon]
MLDLDHFGEITKKAGWLEYKPNIVSGMLTELVIELLSKHHGTHLRGINFQRGTEEAVLFFSTPDPQILLEDLETLRKRIQLLQGGLGFPVTISIGLAFGPSLHMRISDSSNLKQIPLFISAKKALRKAKKQGGNRIIVF